MQHMQKNVHRPYQDMLTMFSILTTWGRIGLLLSKSSLESIVLLQSQHLSKATSVFRTTNSRWYTYFVEGTHIRMSIRRYPSYPLVCLPMCGHPHANHYILVVMESHTDPPPTCCSTPNGGLGPGALSRMRQELWTIHNRSIDWWNNGWIYS